jgi:hypothetical protein
LIVEQKIGETNRSPNDYKFHMFGSNPLDKWFLQINSGRHNELKLNIYDEEFKMIEVQKSGLPNGDVELPPIDQLQLMLKIAKRLCQGHHYVRVDLYLVAGNIFFGELTFTPGCGFGEFSDLEISKRFGSYFEEVMS